MTPDTLAGAARLTAEGDLAAQMVAGINRFLDRALVAARAERDASSPALADEARRAKRTRLGRLLGVVDARVPFAALELVETSAQPALVASAPGYDVYAVRWPALDGIDGEGLWLRPSGAPLARVIALPDADCTPEQAAGLAPMSRHGEERRPGDSQAPGDGRAAETPGFAQRLAEAGCEVVVPALVDRSDTWSGNHAIRMTNQPHREFVYRMAYELGRHVIGYEVQQALALVDYFSALAGADGVPVGVYGYGEGGLLALYSAALDERIASAGVSGYFGDRYAGWREPIYRNVWQALRGFSDADLAALVAPRPLVIEASAGPAVAGPPPVRQGRQGAAPGRLAPIPRDAVRTEVSRARGAYTTPGEAHRLALVEPASDDPGPGSAPALAAFLQRLRPGRQTGAGASAAAPFVGAQAPAVAGHASPPGQRAIPSSGPRGPASSPADAVHVATNAAGGETFRQGTSSGEASARPRRLFEQMCRHTQRLLHQSWRTRAAFWQEADTRSPEAWRETAARYRHSFWDEVIGRCPPPSLPANPRARVAYERTAWTGWEVTLDLWPEVFAYGVLLVPNDVAAGERRPVVVCQHGLEGRPQDVVEKEGPPYGAFAARLAERGYVVYAPQNPYIGQDAFRVIQRKAHPLGWSLFSFIVAQHARTLEWLATLPFVDAARIGFYGLSYGGKTAMRVPALLEGYCLSICSGDFNEWVVKCASTDLPMSYLFTAEYDMYEFDLGSTCNYAEMAWLIAPRPFMVERGHRDGVGLDEWVAFEYAKVRRRYADLGIPERTEIAFFEGGHMIHGEATFAFLDRHLRHRRE